MSSIAQMMSPMPKSISSRTSKKLLYAIRCCAMTGEAVDDTTTAANCTAAVSSARSPENWRPRPARGL